MHTAENKPSNLIKLPRSNTYVPYTSKQDSCLAFKWWGEAEEYLRLNGYWFDERKTCFLDVGVYHLARNQTDRPRYYTYNFSNGEHDWGILVVNYYLLGTQAARM